MARAPEASSWWHRGRRSERSPASRRALSKPWQAKQFSARIGRTSRLYCTSSAASGPPQATIAARPERCQPGESTADTGSGNVRSSVFGGERVAGDESCSAPDYCVAHAHPVGHKCANVLTFCATPLPPSEQFMSSPRPQRIGLLVDTSVTFSRLIIRGVARYRRAALLADSGAAAQGLATTPVFHGIGTRGRHHASHCTARRPPRSQVCTSRS